MISQKYYLHSWACVKLLWHTDTMALLYRGTIWRFWYRWATTNFTSERCKTFGNNLKKNAYLITGCDGLHPTFAKIFDISVVLDIVLLQHCTVEYFDDQYHAYAVVIGSADQSFASFNQLTDHSVLQAHKNGDTQYVYMKHYFHVL